MEEIFRDNIKSIDLNLLIDYAYHLKKWVLVRLVENLV